MERPFILFVSDGDLLLSALCDAFKRQYSGELDCGCLSWEGALSDGAACPDIIVMCDEAGAGWTALDARLEMRFPEALRILLFGSLTDADYRYLMYARIAAIVSRRCTLEAFFGFTQLVLVGRVYVEEDVQDVFANLFRNRLQPRNIQSFNLTDKERKVLVLACADMTSRQIADAMAITPRTVETHKRNITRKTHAKSFFGALVILMKTGSWMLVEG